MLLLRTEGDEEVEEAKELLASGNVKCVNADGGTVAADEGMLVIGEKADKGAEGRDERFDTADKGSSVPKQKSLRVC